MEDGNIISLTDDFTGDTVEDHAVPVSYTHLSYGGKVEGISVIFGAIDNIDGYPVHAVFDASSLPDFTLSDPDNCPNCKAGVKLDAVVNSYGYTEL